MELEFAKISFVHCFRDANEVADSLAKISLTIRSSGFLENVLPFNLLDNVAPVTTFIHADPHGRKLPRFFESRRHRPVSSRPSQTLEEALDSMRTTIVIIATRRTLSCSPPDREDHHERCPNQPVPSATIFPRHHHPMFIPASLSCRPIFDRWLGLDHVFFYYVKSGTP